MDYLARSNYKPLEDIFKFKSRIKAYAESIPTGQWITGGDWDHENWGGELPTKEWIDEFTPENPVFIRRLDGHMSLANSMAMELAKIDGNTAEVEGGKIERDAQGNPTGLFRDNAMNLVFNIMPPPSEQEFEKTDEAVEKVVNLSFDLIGKGAVDSMLDFAKFMYQNN